MHVGDWVLRAIADGIAAHAPERGGALLGPPQVLLVTQFVPDPEAATTSSSYRPSRALDARVKELERETGLELKGIVHSHPRGLDHPSDHDAAELATGLRLNGHMACYLLPIVTAPPEGPLRRHELPAGAGKVSFYAGYRTRSGDAQVRPCRVVLVPLLADLERAARLLGCPVPEPSVTDAGSGPALVARLALDGAEVLLLASEHYPALPPVLLVTPAGGATEQLHVSWRLDLPEEERLAAALREAFDPPGPYRAAFGPPAGPPLTADPERARRAGWRRRFTSADPVAAADGIARALFTRSDGVLHEALRGRRVLVAGCGSVGSYAAEQLVRAGVGAMTLVDPETVEAANLSRTAYEVADVGRHKTDALARVLLNEGPTVSLRLHPDPVEQLPAAVLDEEVRAADLVLAATDDPGAQRALNRFAYARGRPAVFVGLYAGAKGGEVVLSVPGRTPCYVCATATRHRAEAASGRVAREADYGTGRLQGEIAIAADIHHVASAAVKLALSLLLPEHGGGSLKAFADEVLEDGTSYLTLSMVPRYWFYPAIFQEIPGQGAYQSVWLTVNGDDACPVCGRPELRADPLEVPLRAPARAEIEAALRAVPPRG